MPNTHLVLLGVAAVLASCSGNSDQIDTNKKAIEELSASVDGAATMLERLEALEALAADLDSRQSALQGQTLSLTSKVRLFHRESLFVVAPDGARIGRVVGYNLGGVLMGVPDAGLVGATLTGGTTIPGTSVDSIRFANADCTGAVYLPGGQAGQDFPGALVQSTGEIYVSTGTFFAAQATGSRLPLRANGTCENVSVAINGFEAALHDTFGPMPEGISVGPLAWQ